MPRLKLTIIILLFILPALACGGGGDSDTRTTDYPTAAAPIGEN